MYKKIFISFVLVSYFFSPVEAVVRAAHYGEMVTALATIPLDISAHVYEQKKDEKKAAILYLVADVMSIANKILFLCNNITAQQAQDVHKNWNYSRDIVVNGAYLGRDFTKFFGHVQDIVYGKVGVIDDFDFKEVDKVDDVQVIDENLEEQKISEIISYACEIGLFPMLKGLTAFALACTQEGVTGYSGQQARFVVTAAHSLVRLSEEYTLLKSNSSYKRAFQAALIINALWFAYEIKNYVPVFAEVRRVAEERRLLDRVPVVREEIEARLAAERAALPYPEKRLADCLCGDDNVNQVHLGCGHAAGCADCAPRVVNAALAADPIDRLRCPEHNAGCGHTMTRNEIAALTDNNADHLRMFDEAQLERVFLATPEGAAFERLRLARAREADQGLAREALRAMGGMECPQCHIPIVRNEGCNHMTCRNCRNQFCYICEVNWERSENNYNGWVHPQPACPPFDGVPRR